MCKHCERRNDNEDDRLNVSLPGERCMFIFVILVDKIFNNIFYSSSLKYEPASFSLNGLWFGSHSPKVRILPSTFFISDNCLFQYSNFYAEREGFEPSVP